VSYPNFAVIGWDEGQDDQKELIFKHLVERNSINLYAQKTFCEVFHPGDQDEQITQRIKGILDGTAPQLEHHALPVQDTSEMRPSDGDPKQTRSETGTKIHKALLLVGSHRKEQSSSLSLGSYLCSQLQHHAIETEKVLLYAKSMKEDQEEVFAKIDKADLVILAFPLYVDSLPSPVIEFLEQLASHRDTDTSKTLRKNRNTTQLVALANCGFPEAEHNDTALAIAGQFSKRAGFLWRGGIGVGGGNGFGGRSLEERKQATVSIRQALDLASEALAKGDPIPQASVDLAAKEPYPSSLFRFGAKFFWKAAAAKHGAKSRIEDRPYSTG